MSLLEGNRVTKAIAERILTHFETSLENSERPESRKGERSKRRQRPINNVHFPPRPSEPDGQGGKLFDIKKKMSYESKR